MSLLAHDQYSFNWSNHMGHIRNSLATLFNESLLLDVTLCCDGGRLSAHKVLLSMCSPYFRDVFKENPCPHPIVILKDVTCSVMEALLQFMYDGEVTVDCDDFSSFMKTAEVLQVSGLTEGLEEGGEPQDVVTSRKALRVQKGKRGRIDGPTELRAVKKKKEVRQDSSESQIKHSPTPSECSNNESGTIDTFIDPEINVKDEGLLKTADIVFMNEDEDHNTNPLEEQTNILPLEGSIQELGIEKVEDFLDAGKPSASALHLHRCFSSTAVPKKAVVIRKVSPTNNSTKPKYLCTICGKMFTHEKSYEQHRNVHEGRTKCPICDKVLCRKYQLKIHLQKQHKDENISVDDIVPLLQRVGQKTRRFYKCSECHKEYGNQKSLRQHMWMHKGRTRCNICDKVLGRKYELKLHLNSAHGIITS